MRAREALEFCELVQRVDPETLSQIEVVSAARRPLLVYAAIVLGQLIQQDQPESIVVSALGVREGLLFSLLSEREKTERSADRRARATLNVLPLAFSAARRGTGRLDRPAHGFNRHQRNGGGAAAASRRMSHRR